jgi:hypothetical protein
MCNSTEYSMVFFRVFDRVDTGLVFWDKGLHVRHLNHRTKLLSRKDAHTGAHNRYGLDIHRKEEFCCLLPETPIEESTLIAERFGKKIPDKTYCYRDRSIDIISAPEYQL